MGLVKYLYSLSDKLFCFFTAADALLKALTNITLAVTKSVIRLSQQKTEGCLLLLLLLKHKNVTKTILTADRAMCYQLIDVRVANLV